MLLCFALFSRLKIGHWPYYAHPDPKQLDAPFLHSITLFGFLLSFLAVVIAPLALVVAAFIDEKEPGIKKKIFFHTMAVYLLGISLWSLDISMGEFTNWLID